LFRAQNIRKKINSLFIRGYRQMQSLANRLAIQHFVNAYTQETGKGHLLNKNQQSPQQQAFSQGLTLLSVPIHSIQAQRNFHLSYVSRVGRHRLADLPQRGFGCILEQKKKGKHNFLL